MNRTLLVFSTALGLLTACPGDDGNGDTGDSMAMTSPTTDAMTTDAMTTDAMTTDAMTTDAMTTDAMTTDAMTTDAMTTEATTDAMTTDAMTDTGTGGNPACEPEGDDDKCSMCLKDMCCDQLQACRDNAECSCIIDCLDEMGGGVENLPACQKECRVEGLPPGGLELQMCQGTMCADAGC
jgi:pentapeptide MXKDX repeat protein